MVIPMFFSWGCSNIFSLLNIPMRKDVGFVSLQLKVCYCRFGQGPFFFNFSLENRM